MSRSPHLLFRKLKTLGLTIARCSNWFAIARAKLRLGRDPETVQLRSGLRLKIMPPLRATWGEIFEPAIADLYQIRSASPDLIIDVGANIGSFACLAARLHPASAVHAFEPSEVHAQLLQENVQLNRLTNVTLHRQAVTRDGREVLFSALGSGGGSGIFLHDGGRPTALRSTSLATIDFRPFHSLFLKLDCEGAEGEIVEWICANLATLPAKIVIACEYHHWCPVPHRDIVRALREARFRVEEKTLFDESYLFASRDPSEMGRSPQ